MDKLKKRKERMAHKMVSMTKDQFVKEHKDLTKVLRTGKGLKGEYKEQSEELKKVLHTK